MTAPAVAHPALSIRGIGLRGPAPAAIDVGNAGTLLRLLPGWLAGQDGGRWTLDGDDSIRRRPVDRVAIPLREMGADLSAREERLPPLEIAGAPLRGIEYELPVASAQVKSCLLFAGLLAQGETRIVEPLPTRDHSERMLVAAGASVRREELGDGSAVVAIEPAERLQVDRIVVPADLSSAAFMVVAALLVGDSEVTIREVGLNPTRTGLLTILARMGAEIETVPGGEEGASRSATSGCAHPSCGRPRSAAPRCRWRSTSCRWSLSPPASPRARRRSATPPSCAARSPTGSPPSPLP